MMFLTFWTIVETFVCTSILIAIAGGFLAIKYSFRNRSTGQYQYPRWWFFDKHFMTKKPNIVAALSLSYFCHILSQIALCLSLNLTHHLPNTTIVFQFSLAFSCLSAALIYLFMYFKALTLPHIIRDFFIINIINRLCAFLIILSPFIQFSFMNNSFRIGDNGQITIINTWALLCWGSSHSLGIFFPMIMFIYPLTKAKPTQHNYLEPIMNETVLFTFLSIFISIGFRLTLSLLNKSIIDQYSLLIIICFKVEVLFNIAISLFFTRWGWRSLEHKNVKRRNTHYKKTEEVKKRVTLTRTSTITIKEESVQQADDIKIDIQLQKMTQVYEFESCLFPCHRRSLTMTHIDFENLSNFATPQKTLSLNIPT